MNDLISVVKSTIKEAKLLPFSVYSSIKEQRLLNVPIAKPLFIAVLSGDKKLGKNHEIKCSSGDFIFLSDSPAINMRNIPNNEEYYALLIEFEYQDFLGLQTSLVNKQSYCVGEINFQLARCLQQFVEYSLWASPALWSLRRKEIIHLLCHLGHEEVLSMVANPKVGHKLHDIVSSKLTDEITLDNICQQLGMSESTLRRKLKAEDTSVQEIKDQAKLGQGLHLLQTTHHSIGLIAEKCGYQSQSRFTDRFKGRFGITPSELRKTKA